MIGFLIYQGIFRSFFLHTIFRSLNRTCPTFFFSYPGHDDMNDPNAPPEYTVSYRKKSELFRRMASDTRHSLINPKAPVSAAKASLVLEMQTAIASGQLEKASHSSSSSSSSS